MWKKYFGHKKFYKQVAFIALPLALQQLLSSAMGIADSIMVSWIGEVTAVGTASQIENLCITICFGVVTGIGIFAAQFFGAKAYSDLKKAFGLSAMLSFMNGLIWVLLVLFVGEHIVRFYIQDESVIASSLRYLEVVKYSYIPLSLSFCFSYIYRCMHKTYIPMFIGLSAMTLNICINYLLIFGNFGFPKLDVVGAAWGTLIAQSFSLCCYIIYSYGKKQPFVGSFSEMFYFKSDFVKPILRRTYPLIINETFFSLGSTLYIKAFGLLGKNAMDSYYVGNQIANMFFAACNGVSSATGAVLGSSLGANHIEQAKQEGNWFIGISGVLSIIVSVIILLLAKPLVMLFGLENPAIFKSAVIIVSITSIRISLRFFNVIVFGALRAGGDSKFLMFLDAGILWSVGIPLAYILVLFSGINEIAIIFALVQLEQVVRIMIGMKRYYTYRWAKNLTHEVNV